MDLLKLLRSFEELLFELLSWIIYYPLTMARAIRHPLRMMRYSNHEQGDADTERYTDTLSPPLLLLTTIALVHGIDLATHAPTLTTNTTVGRMLTASDENMIIGRAFLFGLLPLFAAWRYVAARGQPLERKNLRPPFYGQCYPAAAYALMLPLAMLLARRHFPGAAIAGGLAMVAATGWYITVQTLQFRASLGWTTARSLGLALRAFGEGIFAFILVALVIAYGP